MGLFSRKKQREPPPPSPHPPPLPRASSSAPATTTLATTTTTTSTHLSSSQASAYGRNSTSYDDRPSSAAYSPELAASSNSRVFRGHAARAASSSTLSLPSLGATGRGDMGGAPRQRQASATATIMSSVDEHDPPAAHAAASSGAQGGSKWGTKWKFGRGSKGKQGSSSSAAAGGDGPGLGLVDDGDGDSGFVVRSFRTVSRVQEDRAPLSSSASAVQQPPPPPVPPLSYHPNPKPAVAAQQDPHQPDSLSHEPQESLRTSIDFNNPSNHSRPPSSFHYPRRPSLATLGGGGGVHASSSSSAWERAPSPTMTAEAFRFRSRSTLSLASATDLALGPGPGPGPALDSSDPHAPRERPRFEPQQRPASARRGSTYSELGASTSSSILAPPRPSFVGMHSNSSNSSIGSRASSSNGAGAAAAAAASAPSSPGAGASRLDQSRRTSMSYERPSMSTSTSLFSMASYSTAQQQQPPPSSSSPSRSGNSTPVRLSTRHASPATSPTTSTAPSALVHERRPAPPQRMSTDDSELRLIAAYGDMLNSSPPVASPLELEPEPGPERLASYATPRKVSYGPGEGAATPAVAVQPPTPQSVPGFASAPVASSSASRSPPPSTTRRASTLVPRPQRSSSLFNESAQAALAAMGVGTAPPRAPAPAAAARAPRAKGKNAVYPSRGGAGGWASDSSEGEERLSSSSDEDDGDERDGSSSDDEVPLAQIRSRSQVDLSLPASTSASASASSARASIDGGSARAPPPPPLPSRHDGRDLYRKPSSELEILRDQHSPPVAGSFGGARDKAHHQAHQQQQQQQQLGMGNPLVRRGSNRRSLSTLSFSTSMTASQQATAVAAASASTGVPGAVATAPPSPARSGATATRGILRPPYGARSVSNPASPTVQAFQSSSSSSSGIPPVPALQDAVHPPVASPLFASVTARDRSSASASASSGSGSASTSSVPITPKDSPSASHLGFPSSSLHLQQQQQHLGGGESTGASALGKPSVKFDPVASQTDAAGWNRGRRLSAITSSAASALGAPVPLPQQQQQQQQPSLAHRATPSMPHLGAGYAASSARGSSQQQHLNPRSSALASARSSMSAAAPHTRASSTASASNGPSTAPSSITAVDDGVYDRMKARHKAEALDALRIGRDLNHPSGLVPERTAVGGGGGGESSDEDEPLANLPTKGSVLGGAGGSVMGGGAGSMMGGMHPQMAMGMGGAFSPLAVAPPGVDPYLYASLPLDHKMSLHQRAAQMMQMMHQASLQARAESVVAGSMLGGHDGSSNQSFRGGLGGSGGGMGHGSSMSLGSFDQFAQGGAGAGYGQGHGPHQHSSSMQLPPFAPSFAMSQPFFHPAQYSQAPSLYGMPAYAGSALGFSTGPMSAYGGGGGGAPQSVMGHPASTGQLRASGGRGGGARAASTMGTAPRRP
ncbi:hypothetical protein JCM3775_000644 [Rhodotorula graminis]